MNCILALWMLAISFFVAAAPAFVQTDKAAAENTAGLKTVAGALADTGIHGTIKIWKTRVKTEGPTPGKDVLVYLIPKNGATFPPSSEKVQMDQRGLIFLPHVLPIQKGTTVIFLNNDQVDHNVYFLFEKTGEVLDLGTWGYGISRDYQFNETGPVITLCKLHLEMAAYIIVLDTPYYTLAEIDKETQSGTFTISNVPAGSYTINAWHKKLKLKGSRLDIVVQEGELQSLEIVMTKAKYAK